MLIFKLNLLLIAVSYVVCVTYTGSVPNAEIEEINDPQVVDPEDNPQKIDDSVLIGHDLSNDEMVEGDLEVHAEFIANDNGESSNPNNNDFPPWVFYPDYDHEDDLTKAFDMPYGNSFDDHFDQLQYSASLDDLVNKLNKHSGDDLGYLEFPNSEGFVHYFDYEYGDTKSFFPDQFEQDKIYGESPDSEVEAFDNKAKSFLDDSSDVEAVEETVPELIKWFPFGEDSFSSEEDSSSSEEDSSSSEEDSSSSEEDSSSSEEDSSSSEEDSSSSEEDSSSSEEESSSSGENSSDQDSSSPEEDSLSQKKVSLISKENSQENKPIEENALGSTEIESNGQNIHPKLTVFQTIYQISVFKIDPKFKEGTENAKPIDSQNFKKLIDVFPEIEKEDKPILPRRSVFSKSRWNILSLFGPLLMISGAFLTCFAIVALATALKKKKHTPQRNRCVTRIDVPYKELRAVNSPI